MARALAALADDELSRVEARLAVDLDLAHTLVDQRAATIEPRRHISTGGRSAVEALRDLGASLDRRLDIHETLGEGGMGIVHRATQTTLGRHVAVKTLREGVADMDATLRILREAWVTGSLEHPNVVPVYDVGVDAKGSPVIVMKRIEGRSWGDLMAQPEEIAKRFGAADPLEWNLRILTFVCNAVHFAHSRDILHRDLKPENVMVGSFGEVYLLDWGIAISLKEDPTGRLPSRSSATEVAGTPQYMAPEMLLGDASAFSPRTDVYLLGAILYEIFCGRPPHDGDSVHAMLSDILYGVPRFPEGVPEEARGICERAMRRDPSERYESAEALRRAVDEYLLHRGSHKLAAEAHESLKLLRSATAVIPGVSAGGPGEPASDEVGDEAGLLVANLLGECRFGYRAALEAWPGNEAARQGLDESLLAVVRFELDRGEAHAAASLLRQVALPPADVTARVEAAEKARVDHDARLNKLETDLDPAIGTRTRGTLAMVFGVLWTLSPLAAWIAIRRGYVPTHTELVALPLGFLTLGLVAFAWARETMTKTLLNRRLSLTFGLYLVIQALLSIGTRLAGMSLGDSRLVIIAMWGLLYTMLAIWTEPWFALPAVSCIVTFLASAAFPSGTLPLMSLDHLIFTVVLFRLWLPKEERARIREHRRELRRQAHQWIRDAMCARPFGVRRD